MFCPDLRGTHLPGYFLMDAKDQIVPDKRLPRFVTGSTMRHVLVMSATGTAGLFAIFLVEFLTLLYISRLPDQSLKAGVAAATVVLFLTTSINVGLMIAVGALVSRSLGQGDREKARHLATTSLILLVVGSSLVAFTLLPLLPVLLPGIGASTQTYPVARSFLAIVLPSNGIIALGMGLSAVLRASGEAKTAMLVTLASGLCTAVLDPIFIFIFGLGVEGAAIVVVLARSVSAIAGFYYTVKVLDALARPNWSDIKTYARSVFSVGLPAILTNLATPVAGAFTAKMIQQFGDNAFAANGIVDRLIPVAFVGLFALSGCVGPILGQNWGAQRYDRMRQILKDATLVTGIYVMAIWAALIAGHALIASAFKAEGLTADLITFFCFIAGPIWIFNGLLFVANASFNNLGFPFLSTAFNWGRATIGVVPFAYIGAHFGGPKGLYIGVAIGSVLFGLAAIVTAFWTVRVLERRGMVRQTG